MTLFTSFRESADLKVNFNDFFFVHRLVLLNTFFLAEGISFIAAGGRSPIREEFVLSPKEGESVR